MATISDLQAVVEASPDNWELRRQLVEALVAEGEHDAAVEVVNQGTDLPHEPGPWLEAAQCYAAVGAIEQARGLVASSLQLDPEYAPALAFQQQLEDHVAATMGVEGEGAQASEEAGEGANREDGGEIPAPSWPPPPTIRDPGAEHLGSGGSGGSGDRELPEPMTLPKVSFSSTEMDALHEAEDEARMVQEAVLKRDRMNSMIMTALILAAIFAILVSIATQLPPNGAPNVVARNVPNEIEETLETETMEKPTVEPTSAASEAVDAIVSNAESAISLNNLDVEITGFSAQGAVSFNPSVSAGMPSSGASKMMFGQELEGDVLGVVLDVSGSMAEFLPLVLKEVDRNFKEAPIVYSRSLGIGKPNQREIARAKKRGDPIPGIQGVAVIQPEKVVKTIKKVVDGETRTIQTPYYFLWNDLPAKAPQRYVDRLIESFKTRPNSFMRGGNKKPASNMHVIEFLVEQGVDAIYIFSDFEDPIDEEIAGEISSMLRRKDIQLYVQPAKRLTKNFEVLNKRAVRQTGGRALPPLTAILSGSDTGYVESEISDGEQLESENFSYATPRAEDVFEAAASRVVRKRKRSEVAKKLVRDKFDIAFLKPRPVAVIFLKNDEGQYIQSPFMFQWESSKWVKAPTPEDPNRMARTVRNMIEVLEEPDYSGEELVWKMQMEQGMTIEWHVTVSADEVKTNLVVDNPKKARTHDAVTFRIPPLFVNRADYFHSPDTTGGGLTLKEVRLASRPNTMTISLDRGAEKNHGKQWERLGMKGGKNPITMNTLIRNYPAGVTGIRYEGPSWGSRVVEVRGEKRHVGARSAASKPDAEAWEGTVVTFGRGERSASSSKSDVLGVKIE